jgi:hypothetical protein
MGIVFLAIGAFLEAQHGSFPASLHPDCAVPTHFGHRSDGAEKLSE